MFKIASVVTGDASAPMIISMANTIAIDHSHLMMHVLASGSTSARSKFACECDIACSQYCTCTLNRSRVLSTELTSVGLQVIDSTECYSAFFSTNVVSYQHVCGRTGGYQMVSTEAFLSTLYNPSITMWVSVDINFHTFIDLSTLIWAVPFC